MDVSVDFVIVDDDNMPPLMITPNEDDSVKVVLNMTYRTWLALNRKTIGGLGEPVFDKIDFMLQSWLEEQRMYEKTDGGV